MSVLFSGCFPAFAQHRYTVAQIDSIAHVLDSLDYAHIGSKTIPHTLSNSADHEYMDTTIVGAMAEILSGLSGSSSCGCNLQQTVNSSDSITNVGGNIGSIKYFTPRYETIVDGGGIVTANIISGNLYTQVGNIGSIGNQYGSIVLGNDHDTGYYASLVSLPYKPNNVSDTLTNLSGPLVTGKPGMFSNSLVAASSLTINHGLAYTPSIVICIPVGATSAGYLSGYYIIPTTGLTAYTFTIGFASPVTGTLTFLWIAF